MGFFDFLKGAPNVEEMQRNNDVNGLIKALKHKQTTIREKATKVLETLNDERAAQALREDKINQEFRDTRGDLQRKAEESRRMKQTQQKTPITSTTVSKATKYSGPPIRDLTQTDLIRELQRMGLSAAVAGQQVHSAIMMTSIFDSDQISKIHNSDTPLTLDDLPLRWAAHCVYHGARASGR
jgi:hypothetical protein